MHQADIKESAVYSRLGFAVQFENDVYIATSEPHGNIEAVITRKDAMPHARL